MLVFYSPQILGNYPKNKELEKYKLELKSNEVENTTSIDKFIDYSKKVITHLEKLAIQRERPDLINIAFEIVFNGQVEFDKISCHTPDFPALASILNQQKNPSCDEFSQNHLWQPH